LISFSLMKKATAIPIPCARMFTAKSVGEEYVLLGTMRLPYTSSKPTNRISSEITPPLVFAKTNLANLKILRIFFEILYPFFKAILSGA